MGDADRGKSLVPSWGSGGNVLCLCLGMAYYFHYAVARGVCERIRCRARRTTAVHVVMSHYLLERAS